jgi:hypothetical protein
VVGASLSHHAQGGIRPDGSWHAQPLAASARQPTRHRSRASLGNLIHGRLRWLHRLPLAVSRHATVSTVPRFQGQGRPPGQTSGRRRTMTEASVSFAGNLTDQPEHAAQSLAKGSRVVVVGQLSQRLGTLHGGTHLDLWKCRLPSRNCGGWWRSWLVGGLPAPGPGGATTPHSGPSKGPTAVHRAGGSPRPGGRPGCLPLRRSRAGAKVMPDTIQGGRRGPRHKGGVT